MTSRVEGWIVSPRKSRRKSACFSRTRTSTPVRASSNPSIMPAGPPPAMAQRTAGYSLIARASPLGSEPTPHELVEGVRLLHVREMPSVSDLFVARSENQARDALVLVGRSAGILAATHDQAGNLERWQLRHEIEIKDRRGAAQESRRRRRGNGIADLLPALRLPRLVGAGEPALERGVGDRRERGCLGDG